MEMSRGGSSLQKNVFYGMTAAASGSDEETKKLGKKTLKSEEFLEAERKERERAAVPKGSGGGGGQDGEAELNR